MSSSLSIIIPAFDESARIGKTLREVLNYLGEQPGGGEVIVVDDGSGDDTSRVAAEFINAHARERVEGRVIRVEPNRGKGNAVRTGLLAARNTVAAFFDAELLFIAYRSGLRMLEYPVRWDDVAGGTVNFKTGLQGFAELRQIRQNARRGLYDAAIARARESAARVKDRRALTGDDNGIE